jgi:hypothetical protein
MTDRQKLLARTREQLAEAAGELTAFTTMAQLPEDGGEIAARSRWVSELAAWAAALEEAEQAVDLLDEFDRYAAEGYPNSPFERRVVAFLHTQGRRSEDGTLCLNGGHLYAPDKGLPDGAEVIASTTLSRRDSGPDDECDRVRLEADASTQDDAQPKDAA